MNIIYNYKLTVSAIKYIYMLRIQMKQNFNILLTNKRVQGSSVFLILKPSKAECSNNTSNIYKNIEKQNKRKKKNNDCFC